MKFTADQIAALVNGVVDGDGSVTVSTIAKIEEGHSGAISFLANPKYTHYIYTTESSIVLVNKDFVAEAPVNATLIRVDDPYATVASLLDMVSKMIQPQPSGIENPAYVADGVELPEDVYIGAFSYVGKGAVIGKGVKIYPQCYVGDNVKIGDNTVLNAGVKVYYGCEIGSQCIIHSGAVIGADGFGFAPVDGHYNKIPQIGNVVIGNNVEIGANTCVDRSTMGSTVISDGVKLDNLIQIAHNCRIGHDTVMASQAGVAGSTKVGANCMIGGQVGISGHISIGDRVMIGAQSGIPRDVAPDSHMMGYPAVEYTKFARQVVNVKNLDSLYRKVADLEKQIKENK